MNSMRIISYNRNRQKEIAKQQQQIRNNGQNPMFSLCVCVCATFKFGLTGLMRLLYQKIGVQFMCAPKGALR